MAGAVVWDSAEPEAVSASDVADASKNVNPRAIPAFPHENSCSRDLVARQAAGPLTQICANGREDTEAPTTVRIRTKVRKVSPLRAHVRAAREGGAHGLLEGAERIVVIGEGMCGVDHEPAERGSSFYVLTVMEVRSGGEAALASPQVRPLELSSCTQRRSRALCELDMTSAGSHQLKVRPIETRCDSR